MEVSILTELIDLIAKLLSRIMGIGYDHNSAGKFSLFDISEEESIDDRIKKIDVARSNLVDGLNAIDELRIAAEQNKREVQQTLQQIAQMKTHKQNLENELNSLNDIIHTDVQTFRAVAGIPSPSDVRQERVLGFISGIIASIVAWGLIYGVTELIKHWYLIINWLSMHVCTRG